MKNIIFNIIIGVAIGVIAACEPIIERESLSNSFDFSELELIATQSTPGGNEITLKMNTKGVYGHWDYNIGTALTDEVTIIYPIPGTATFNYYVGTPYMTDNDPGNVEFLKPKTIEVEVDTLDHELDPAWYKLVGNDLAAGKTWVLAKDRPAGKEPYPLGPAGMYSFMSDPTNWLALWWNAGECCPPVDHEAEMHFDLNGAANYTYTNGSEVVKGSFVLLVKDELLLINDANLVGALGAPGQISDTQGGVYQLKVIDENEIILYQVHGTGWTWIFKPKGYVYP